MKCLVLDNEVSDKINHTFVWLGITRFITDFMTYFLDEWRGFDSYCRMWNFLIDPSNFLDLLCITNEDKGCLVQKSIVSINKDSLSIIEYMLKNCNLVNQVSFMVCFMSIIDNWWHFLWSYLKIWHICCVKILARSI